MTFSPLAVARAQATETCPVESVAALSGKTKPPPVTAKWTIPPVTGCPAVSVARTTGKRSVATEAESGAGVLQMRVAIDPTPGAAAVVIAPKMTGGAPGVDACSVFTVEGAAPRNQEVTVAMPLALVTFEP